MGIGKNWLEDNQTNFTDGIYLLTDAITAEDKENEEEQKSDLEKVEQLKDTIPDLLRGAVSSKKQKEIADETRVRVANEIPNDSAGFLLRIIHSPKYYMDRGWSDPHNDRDNGSRPVQHIMLESCNKKDLTSLILNSLLNYLYKRDLETGKMTQFDVEILRSINQEMTFVWKDISEKYPRYFQADLEPAGKITIKEVEKNERNDFTEYDHNDLGIIKVGQNSLFHIRNTEGRMLPDFSKRAEEAAKLKDEERIYAQLKERIPNFSQLPIEMLVKELSEQPDLNLSTNSLKTAMYHVIWESNKDEAQMRDVKAWANSEPKTGQMGELQKELKTFLETHNSKTYTRTLRNQFGKHWRRVENLEKFYGGLVGINYLIDANELVYAVGVPKGVNRAITRASVIKRIIPFDKDEKNISWYPDFIKLLETTTIRFKQTTVLPFIFKYIREYAQLHKQDTKPGQEPGPFAYPVEMSF
ncbi:hypothetical protein LCB40_13220 [Lactobacillus corticis]|uniref:Uncharacterized protein n=1 Tax=Lactobacillus corticis TaxID=2201249 RepID=A0A916QJH5_9LACO|nr:hypothetical protein LCB40_13220 [Lactobacillus corticis]